MTQSSSTPASSYGPPSVMTTRRRLFGATALAAAPLTVPGLSPRKSHAADPTDPGTTVVKGNQAQAVVVLPPGYEPTRDISPIEIEAESGVLSGPMQVVSGDEDASGGAFVHAPPGTPTGSGSLTIEFEIDIAASYGFEMLGWGLSGTSDSWSVQIDDGPTATWHMGNDHSGWRWASITDRPASVDEAIVVRLEEGTHQIRFTTREAGARLDRLRIAPAPTATQLNHSADQLIEYVERSTGVRLPMASASDDLTHVPAGRIHLGWTGPDADVEVEQAAAGIDVDGFVLSSKDGVISIVGGSEWGIRYGVYELLERELGVAWLLPGPDGDDVPVRQEWIVENQLDVQEPSFRSRTMPYLFDTNEPHARDWASDDPQVIWATRQRTHSRITNGGNHNLFNVFPPSVYADPTKPTYRPEIFPIIDGQVKIPAPNSGGYGGWQPRFDIELTVDIAVAYIRDYFEQNPDEPLLSLAVNDRAGYSETDFEGDLLNSIGHRSASKSYYAWVNKVVTRALDGHSELTGKIFPVLAYDSVIDPPEFDIHPNVVPMITKEAHAWADRGGVGRAHFSGLFDDWGERATTLALYDYCSGHRYVAPRMITPVLQEAYRYGYSKGMRYSYADMTPAPVGEGPKTWTYGKMMWNLDADIPALTREWCDRVVGPAGGESLFAFYQLWEDFWDGPVQDTAFWQFNQPRKYFHFQIYDYLGMVTPEMAQRARSLLNAAAAAADTPARQARAALLLDSYSFYDAGIQSYPRIVAAPTSPREALTNARAMQAETPARVAKASERLVIKERHDTDPLLDQRWDHYRYNQVWTGYSASDFWNLHDHLVSEEPDGGPVTIMLGNQVRHGSSDDPAVRMAAFILRAAAGEIAPVDINGDFAIGGDDAPPWRFSGVMHRADGVGVDGSAGIVVPPTPDIPVPNRESSMILPIPARTGLFAFRMRYRSTVPNPDMGIASVKVHLWTASGSNITNFAQPMRLLADTGDQWGSIGVVEDIPAVANGVEVGQLRLVTSILSLESEEAVHIDSVTGYWEH